MTTIDASIIEDSVNVAGERLTTFLLTYPRFIHSEFMTHRAVSKNASSSRAIPTKKQLEMLVQDTAMPIEYPENINGMQGGKQLDTETITKIKKLWLESRDFVIDKVKQINELGLSKQYTNRLLEPYSHITVVATATQWSNFFNLRISSDAQPEIHKLAQAIWMLYKSNKPKQLNDGEWHLPFVTEEDRRSLNLEAQIIKSVACCARTSYKNHDKTDSTMEQNRSLFDRLLNRFPIHASPAEHQAMATIPSGAELIGLKCKGNVNGNFSENWVQFRKILPNECADQYPPGDGSLPSIEELYCPEKLDLKKLLKEKHLT